MCFLKHIYQLQLQPLPPPSPQTNTLFHVIVSPLQFYDEKFVKRGPVLSALKMVF